MLPRISIVCALLCASLTAQTDVVAIRGARIVDGTGAAAQVATVVIRGSRIEAVGAAVAVPAGARTIDAAGQTLIPGLFDLHTHLSASAVSGAPPDWGKSLKAYLDCGVTTVDDFSANGEMFAPMRKLLATGAAPGPRVNLAMRVSTPGGHGTEGGWGDFMTAEVSTAAQAHARMKEVLAYKPDVIKVFTDGWRYGAAPDLTSMNLETLAAIVADAHAAGLKVLTHTVTLNGAKIAAGAGVDALAHGIGDAEVDSELIELMKAKGTAYVPTLAVYEQHAPSPADRVRALLEPESLASLLRAAAGRTDPAEASPARARRWQFLSGNVRKLHLAGIPVAAGTDAGMPGTFHGYATLHELELLAQSGLKPVEAIRAGTMVSARVLGVDGDRGTIAPGKIADLVLIDGRPDEQIADIEKTARVFLGGVEVSRARLEEDIRSPGPTELPAAPVGRTVDDMERTDGRTQLGTLRVNTTDPGPDHSVMLSFPVARGGGDHALLISARMASKERPYVRLEMPLTPGGVTLADLSRYEGIGFEARGEGLFRLVMQNYGARRDPFAAPFQVATEWQAVKIPFSALRRASMEEGGWNSKDVRSLLFELSGAPQAHVWLELDNVRFY